MFKKINIDEQPKKDFSEVYKNTFIDIKKPLERQPICLSYGHKFNEYVPLVTYGNFMSIVGASKSYKSFLKTAFLSSYINKTEQFQEIIAHDNKDKFIIDFDTEQSEYHVKKASLRVLQMAGETPFYKPFALRPLSAKERVEFLEYLVYESDFKNDIGLISIDGVADLVENVNDLEKSNEITGKLMKITQDKKCAMITVIHRNFESQKPTGHLGSSVLKKAETVLFVDKQNDVATVKAQYSRNIPIDDFSFTINNGLPEATDDNLF